MPICTSCTNSTPYLYTVYESEYNLRLEQCTKCHAFADPYVEHDTLTLVIDLILLKLGVYRHLLYNRGSEPRRAIRGSGDVAAKKDDDISSGTKLREKRRWLLFLRLGGPLVIVDAFIRWSHLHPNQSMEVPPWTISTMKSFLRVLFGCFAETVAFHLGIIFACYLVLNFLGLISSWRRPPIPLPISDIRREFRFSLIPLALFYSSLTKLFLLFLLTIWHPTSTPTPAQNSSNNNSALYNTYLAQALISLDDDKIDREWVVRNVLGGMSAGFGLRVILDSHPFLTAIIIVMGWAAKTAVASLIGGWVGGDEGTGEEWLAYSIP